MYGDTVVIRRRAGQLREQGADIRAAADRLVARSEAIPWRGRAADAMRERVKERAHHLRASAAAHGPLPTSITRASVSVTARVRASRTRVEYDERSPSARRSRAARPPSGPGR